MHAMFSEACGEDLGASEIQSARGGWLDAREDGIWLSNFSAMREGSSLLRKTYSGGVWFSPKFVGTCWRVLEEVVQTVGVNPCVLRVDS